jgi:hypothetical protein
MFSPWKAMWSGLPTVIIMGLLFEGLLMVRGHFTMVGSREAMTYQDNRRFWPIGPSNLPTLRPLTDCLLYKPTPLKALSAGSSVRFPFEIGNGARHVGQCTADLYNGDGTMRLPNFATQQDCIHQFDAMDLVIPSVNCPSCVIKIKVTAVHLGPEKPEFYDSCIDVAISGGGKETSPVSPTPQPTGNPQVPPPEPPTGTIPGPLPTQTTSPTPSPPRSGSNPSGPCDSTGDAVCDCKDSTMYYICSGSWQPMRVAPGTKCVNGPENGIELVPA